MARLVDDLPGGGREGIELGSVPDVPGVEVLRVDAPSRMWRWYHETYTISLPRQPMHAEWSYRGRTHRTDAGIVALIEPGEMHADVRKFDEREAFRVLFVDPALVDEAARELDGGAGTVHWREVQVRDGELFRRLLRMHAAFEGDVSPLEREACFAAVLEKLLEFGERRPPADGRGIEPDAVRRARAVLDERWAETVRLDELATVAGVGRFRLLRAFRAAVGMPPHRYQIGVRVARARSLIRVGVPLAEVALETGFADQSHLARHFRRVIGVSPGHYRRAVR